MCADIEKDNSGVYAIFKFSVHVTYDPVYHYPSEIEYIFRFYEDGIDGPTGYGLKIDDFKIITEE
jgi:hypothetical protein